MRHGIASSTFWLADSRAQLHGELGHGVQELGTRLAGSRDLFGTHDRGPTASINYVAAHDGFTLADTTAYDVKHNLANGEDNRDGSDGNRSFNHGIEGPTDDPVILAARRRSIRNLMGSMLLSAGIPMINAGDEFGTLVVDTRWDDDEVVHVYNRSRSRVHDRLYPPGPWRHRGQISNPDSLLPYSVLTTIGDT